MSDSASPRAAAFERARQETIRYHEELYAQTGLGSEGTWLAKPHRLVFEALELLPRDRAVVAYDLGAGVGRHTVPMLDSVPAGSVVFAVDLLDSAVRRLAALAPASGSTRLRAQQADLAELEFVEGVDLVFAFSSVEHLADAGSIRRLLGQVDAALRPGGVVALGIVADRYEVDASGSRRPALLESGISVAEVDALLIDSFAGFEVIDRTARQAVVREQRDGEEYLLSSTLVTWLGRKISL
ncbi:class I SAM-dependent methyltransferase [Microbacterium sp. ZKA21]|uniref:class I SAM-dependent methyltransferase n=1 Tax=Microbacterium sp. ZKA21 TaxID=3381694 RepID=UPI003D2566B8